MNTKIILSFIAGGVIGAASTFYYLNKKFEKDLDKEVKEYEQIIKKLSDEEFKEENDAEEDDTKENKSVKENKAEDKQIALDIIEKNQYNTQSKYYSNQAKKAYNNITDTNLPSNSEINENSDYPFMIDESEVGKIDGYKVATLTYYLEDGILADEYDDIMDEEDFLIGTDTLKALGTGEYRVIYVQNNKLKRYFEILLDDSEESYPYAI